MAVKLLVKICGDDDGGHGSVPAPPEEKGEGAPSSSSSLTSSLDGRRVPLWSLASMAWEGRETVRDWICLSVSAFSSAALSPFRIYMEICNSDWPETFTVIFYQKLAFLQPKKGINRLTGGPRGSGARPGGQARPLPRGHLGHRLAWIFLPKNHIYSKKISTSFYPVWTPFDMDFL